MFSVHVQNIVAGNIDFCMSKIKIPILLKCTKHHLDNPTCQSYNIHIGHHTLYQGPIYIYKNQIQ